MPTYEVSAKDYEKLVRKHERERIEKIHGALNEAALLGAELVASRVPVDQGTLKASIHAITGANPEIVADAPHAAVIENGARPHYPPLGPLIDWVKRHAVMMGVEEADYVQVARAIAEKIAREGSVPRWYMRGSQDELRRILKEVVERRF